MFYDVVSIGLCYFSVFACLSSFWGGPLGLMFVLGSPFMMEGPIFGC